jgi:hypothetical protein
MALDLDLYGSVNHLLAPPKINPKLHDIPIHDRVCTALDAGSTQANAAVRWAREECARTRLDVSHVPLRMRAVEPKLAVYSRYNLGLEADRQV